MKTVTKYIADDGKEFTNQEECKTYEKNKWFIDLWEGTGEHAWENGLNYSIDLYSGTDVLMELSKHCIITKKPKAPSAKKVLNKGKDN